MPILRDTATNGSTRTPRADARARTVVNYLVEHGIDRARLTSQGFGLTRPVAGNKTEAERARNRRVQFEIVPTEDTTSLPVSSASGAPG